MDPNYAEVLFNHLYGNISGYDVSNAARKAAVGVDTEALLYGELPFSTWREIVEIAKPKSDGVFFDLGSGTGRVVMSSYLLCDFKKCIGVELLKGLHEKAVLVEGVFSEAMKSKILNHVAERELKFLCQDIFETDLKEADFIFMNHPFKGGANFDLLENKILSEVRPGTKIVTTIRSLQNPRFKSFGKKKFDFSWGESTAYFFEV